MQNVIFVHCFKLLLRKIIHATFLKFVAHAASFTFFFFTFFSYHKKNNNKINYDFYYVT